jgi:hypothetical protein
MKELAKNWLRFVRFHERTGEELTKIRRVSWKNWQRTDYEPSSFMKELEKNRRVSRKNWQRTVRFRETLARTTGFLAGYLTCSKFRETVVYVSEPDIWFFFWESWLGTLRTSLIPGWGFGAILIPIRQRPLPTNSTRHLSWAASFWILR